MLHNLVDPEKCSLFLASTGGGGVGIRVEHLATLTPGLQLEPFFSYYSP